MSRHHELHASEIRHVDQELDALLRDDISFQGIDPLEIEANAFASELMMPKNEFMMTALRASGLDIEEDAGIEALARISGQFIGNVVPAGGPFIDRMVR